MDKIISKTKEKTMAHKDAKNKLEGQKEPKFDQKAFDKFKAGAAG